MPLCQWQKGKKHTKLLQSWGFRVDYNLLTKLIIYTVYANRRKKKDCWITKQRKPLKIQTKWKQPGALKKHTQHSWGLLLLIAAKSANIDMLNRLASLITGRVNMAATADTWGYPVGRQIASVFHILTPASVGLAPCTKDTPNLASAFTRGEILVIVVFFKPFSQI